MTQARKDEAASLLKWAALLAAFFFTVWKFDDHFVTRREFSELRSDVRAIGASLGVKLPAPMKEATP